MALHRTLACTACLISAAATAFGEEVPTGQWQTVDFVRKIETFKAAARSWKGELFLKDFQCSDTGQTSLGWTCKDGWAVHANGTTRHRYFVKRIDGKEYLFLPWMSGDVVERGRKPAYYVLQRRATRPAKRKRTVRPVEPVDHVEAHDDIRWKDLSGLSLADRPGLPATLTFNQQTVWPGLLGMPEGCYPRRIMTDAMNPGLGIRELHRRGITGKGVRVAIIDQPLLPDHPEYADKVAAYHDVGCGTQSSMHGPAVASLLVGEHCGTAPGAKVHYVAAPSWKGDAADYGRALQWIIERNRELPEHDRIRVVSVSAAPSGPGSPFERHQGTWDDACAEAARDGLLVLDCTSHHGFIGPCYYDLADPEDVSKCKPGFPGMPARASSDRILVPSSPRTTAELYQDGQPSYQYCGRGGLSWAIPYCAGVLALGWQQRPDLIADEMRDCLFESAFVTGQGAKIIHPKAFIRTVASRPEPNR